MDFSLFTFLRIRVHACEEVNDSEVGHHDAQEGEGDVDVVGERQRYRSPCKSRQGRGRDGSMPAVLRRGYVCRCP